MFLWLAAACNPPDITYEGVDIPENLPLDGVRAWDYSSEDEATTKDLRVELVSRDDDDVATLEYHDADNGDLLYEVRWSSTQADGIHIHGWSTASGTVTTYDPPIEFAERRMLEGDSTLTETGGLSFTSLYATTEECPNHFTEDWSDCLRFELDDGREDSDLPFLGMYWLVPQWGPARIWPQGMDGAWVLDSAEWAPED